MIMASPDAQEREAPEEEIQEQDQKKIQEQDQKQPKVVIVIAGMARSGKSAALNNVFGANFTSTYSTGSVTRIVAMRRTKGTKGELIIVDTPGFGATDLTTSKVKQELRDSIGGLNFVLVYCYSVSPSSAHSVADEYVVKNLQDVLGKDIWEKCVVLFTFSDLVRAQVCPNVEDRDTYKGFISEHAQEFSEMLKNKCGDHVPDVKSVFELNLDQEDIREIVAVPVGLKFKAGKEKHVLVPGIEDATWLDLALTEIVRKAKEEDREAYLHHMYRKPSLVGPAAGIGIGMAIGAAGGVGLGVATMGIGLAPAIVAGMAVGAVAGGVAGGALGTTGGLSMGEVKRRIIASRNEKEKEKLEKLKRAQLIPLRPAQPHPPTPEPLASAGQTSQTRPMSPPILIVRAQVEPATKSSASAPVVPEEVPDPASYSKGHMT